MHYRVKGKIIKSEFAAKSILQPSQEVLSWIDSRKKINNALDYGCGKLRYAHNLSITCKNLTLVDSKEQIDRIQSLRGHKTTLNDYISKNITNARLLSIEKFFIDNLKYDLALCANVLSVIPSVRIRNKCLNRISYSLKSKGICLFVTQFRDSYFDQIQLESTSEPHLNGWVSSKRKQNAFYGIINKESLERMILKNGFNVIESWVHGSSAFVVGGKQL